MGLRCINVTLPLLHEANAEKIWIGVVCYYREGDQHKAPLGSDGVIQAVTENRLLIGLSNRPDFLDAIALPLARWSNALSVAGLLPSLRAGLAAKEKSLREVLRVLDSSDP
jgi:hypothetical protein